MIKNFLLKHRKLAKGLHGLDHLAHVGYFGAAAMGAHEVYGYAAGVLLVTFIISQLAGGGEA